MRSDLPPLLEFLDGTYVETAGDWERRRSEIRRLICQYFIGNFPDVIPAIIGTRTLEEISKTDGSVRRRIQLVFNTPNQVSMDMWVWIPFGHSPAPILLIQPRDYQIPWAEAALSRGYLVCLYPGVDSHHQEADYPRYESVWNDFRAEYPDVNWTEISTKAWLASRSLDYLLEPQYGYNVMSEQIGIIGFSRYGKQSMVAAAFDDRITAVIARSPGSPASCPYRFTARDTFAETPEDFPGEWFLPSLRSYTGREHQLPIDSHGWYALIAPRLCLIHTAHNDGCEPTFAVEKGYLEGKKVYRFLGYPQNLYLSYRPGGHTPITEEHVAENMDWFDLVFDRLDSKQPAFCEKLIHDFNWREWKSQLSDQDLQVPNGNPLERILWSLGQKPKEIRSNNMASSFLNLAESELMTHDRWHVENTTRLPVHFGCNVRGNLYYNPNSEGSVPVIIWLHPFSYHSGYNEGYGVQGTTVYYRIAQQGCVVLAFDQLGFGLRLLEGSEFYNAYPKWSKLGRMICDVQYAVDFLIDGTGCSKGKMPKINTNHIYLLGYSLGGMVGLYAAALDDRISGVASFCGFTPLRTDTDVKPTGGIRRIWEHHALQPLLGIFHEDQEKIPYDFGDILSLISPRPCLIASPEHDQEADFDDIINCVESIRREWVESPEFLTHLTPNDVNRFQADQHEMFLDWINKVVKKV
ncbi:TPA: hypothetical protein EYN09_01610 [Candidatus Poribacteria bacterium]|nr:hypothetical protein [Candidatus Poribacteria bacterium]HIO05610.1 hypothetical protein [Candidatus Poribacteria bacterium]